jgi:dolichol-phosphate mannosyltransferase
MELWVVIPAYNEAVSEIIERTVDELERAGIDYEVLVVDDASEDETLEVVQRIGERSPRVRCARSHLPHGFEHAVRAGLDVYCGDAVAIMMTDC